MIRSLLALPFKAALAAIDIAEEATMVTLEIGEETIEVTEEVADQLFELLDPEDRKKVRRL